MKHIGITGRMGAGKSFICQIFHENFGIPIFDSDSEAKACYTDADVRKAVCEAFGTQLQIENGQINLKQLGNIVFNDSNKLQTLNQIVHPAVMERYRRWESRQQAAPYSLFESAILFDCHLETHFDAVICIRCPEALRIERVQERNGWSRSDIAQRMQQQQTEVETAARADFIICHDSTSSIEISRKNLLPQISSIHKQLCQQ